MSKTKRLGAENMQTRPERVRVVLNTGRIWQKAPRFDKKTGLFTILSQDDLGKDGQRRRFKEVAFSPSGDKFAGLDSNGHIYIFRVKENRYSSLNLVPTEGKKVSGKTYKKRTATSRRRNKPTSLTFESPTCLIVGMEDGSIQALDCYSSGSKSRDIPNFSIKGHKHAVLGIRISANGLLAATTSSDCLILWDCNNRNGWVRKKSLMAMGARHCTPRFSGEGQILVTCFADEGVKGWDTETFKELFQLPGSEVSEVEKLLRGRSAGLSSFAISSDGTFVVGGDKESGCLSIWATAPTTSSHGAASPFPFEHKAVALPRACGGVQQLEFLPNSRLFACLCTNGEILFVDAAAHRMELCLHSEYNCDSIDGDANSSNGANDDRDCSKGNGDRTREKGRRKGRVSSLSSSSSGLVAVAFSPTARYMAGLVFNGSIQLHDLELAFKTEARRFFRDSVRGDRFPSSSRILPVIEEKSGVSASNPREGGGAAARRLRLDTKRGKPKKKPSNLAEAAEGILPARFGVVPPRHLSRTVYFLLEPALLSDLCTNNHVFSIFLYIVSEKKLRQLLLALGEFPKKYRFLIWRFLLKTPNNMECYASLTNRGVHAAYRDLHNKYPISNSRLFRRLENCLSCLAHWTPLFGEVEFLPTLVFPFVNLMGGQASALETMEVVMSFLHNWAREWFEYFPNPPVSLLATVSHLVKSRDPGLAAKFRHFGWSIGEVAWQLMSSGFSTVFSRNSWLQLFDHIFVNDTAWYEMFTVSFLLCTRKALLAIETTDELELFLRSETTVGVARIITETYRLRRECMREDQPKPLDFKAIPEGIYPVWSARFPAYEVDHHLKERERIAKEEEILYVEQMYQRENVRLLERQILELKKAKAREREKQEHLSRFERQQLAHEIQTTRRADKEAASASCNEFNTKLRYLDARERARYAHIKHAGGIASAPDQRHGYHRASTLNREDAEMERQERQEALDRIDQGLLMLRRHQQGM
eukprot:jgi/Bigna1/86613/estExt_fgenesh1_pg.C_120078